MSTLHPEWVQRPVVIHELEISAFVREEIQPGVWAVVYDFAVHHWTENQVLGLLALEAAWSRTNNRRAS